MQVDSGLPEAATPAPTPGTPSVVLTNPLLGETLYNGGIALVRWVSNAELASVDLTLSDGTAIATGLDAGAANGTYRWAVRAAPAMAYSIAIQAHAADGSVLEDVSGQFAVQDQTTVSLTAPTREQVVWIGEAASIKWKTKGGTVTDVSLAIVSASDSSLVLVDFGTQPNSGEFVWVPAASRAPGRYAVQLIYSPSSASSLTTQGPVFRLRKPPQEGDRPIFVTPTIGEKLELGATYRYARVAS